MFLAVLRGESHFDACRQLFVDEGDGFVVDGRRPLISNFAVGPVRQRGALVTWRNYAHPRCCALDGSIDFFAGRRFSRARRTAEAAIVHSRLSAVGCNVVGGGIRLLTDIDSI